MRLIKIDTKEDGTVFVNPNFIVGVTFHRFDAYISMTHPVGPVGTAGHLLIVTLAEFERLKPYLVEDPDDGDENK